jgi:hypothetical protein
VSRLESPSAIFESDFFAGLKEVHPENAYFIRKKKKGHFRIDPEAANALKAHTELFDCKYRIDPIATPSP